MITSDEVDTEDEMFGFGALAKHACDRKPVPARAFMCVAIVLAALGAACTTGSESDETKPASVQVAFTTASGPPVPFSQTCDAAGACLVPISGGPESTVSGDFEGTGVYAGVAYLVSDDEAFSSAMATFTGIVKGCGSGTNTIRYDAHYGAELDHGGGGTWEIIDGLGTGDLANLSGHGTFTVGETNADFSGTNEFEGQIRC